MHLKAIFVLAVAITLASSQPEGENCEWTYRCCKMTDHGCEELCEPEIVCEDPEATTDDFDINNFQIGPAQMITVGCKNGYKMAKNNKCKKVVK